MPRKKTPAATKRSRSASGRGIQDRKTFPIVGVGASAGGLEAFRSLLQALPANTGMAFRAGPASGSGARKPAHQAAFRRHPHAGDGSHRGRGRRTESRLCDPSQRGPGNPRRVFCICWRAEDRTPKHMPVDFFFQSLAENEGSRAIGVILSGVATDGTLGLAAIKAAGGITFAQDGKSAKYDGMPRSAIAAGCVDFVLSPEGIARELKRIGLHPYLGMPDRAPAGDSAPAMTRDCARFSRSCAMPPASTSPTTSAPPSTGGSRAAWCCTSFRTSASTSSTCTRTGPSSRRCTKTS